jgi:thymidylate kinase
MVNRIAIVGVEGSGKTFFINNIFKLKNYEKIYEPNYEINRILKTENNILDKIEKQNLIHMSMLNRDISLKNNKKYIMERDYISAVFVFKPEDKKYYKELISMHIKNHKDLLPNLVIFFNTDAETCLERIKERNRTYENQITLKNIKDKINLHQELLKIYNELDIKIFNYTGSDSDYDNLLKLIHESKFSINKYLFKLIVKPKVIVIEGNIASGKSTLLKYYKQKGFTVIDEPFEKMNQHYNKDFLEAYYTDQFNRYKNLDIITTESINFQTMVYQYKIKMFNDIYKKEHKNNIIFIERTILSGVDVFCKSNILNNYEKDLINIIYQTNNVKQLCFNASKVIYLRVIPDNCFKRSNERENINIIDNEQKQSVSHCETFNNNNNIDLDLFRSIDVNYELMLKKVKKFGIKVSIFDNNTTIESLIDKVDKCLNIKNCVIDNISTKF